MQDLLAGKSAGHSVGEFAALASAGSIGFADGLQMVAKRGEIMSKVEGGGMAAVIGLDADAIRETLSALSSPPSTGPNNRPRQQRQVFSSFSSLKVFEVRQS